MSMSLRDQLLAAGLVTQRQAKQADRLQERQEHDRGKHARGGAARPSPTAAAAATTKTARDQVLNRERQERAHEKALQAQIKQLIEQNRLPPVEDGEYYSFIDRSKVRRIAIMPAVRSRLVSGELAVVRHAGRYDIVPAAVGVRVGERDPTALIPHVAPPSNLGAPYLEFPVPDDLIW